MPIVYKKKDQGNLTTSGTGAPSHSAVAGDKYTDTSTGINYIYITAWVAISNKNLRINAQTGTSYTLDIADYNTDSIVTTNNASANTVTVPPSVFPIGAQLLVAQIGAGQTTIVAGVGVTLNAVGLKITAQYNAITMVQTASNVWYVFGNLTA